MTHELQPERDGRVRSNPWFERPVNDLQTIGRNVKIILARPNVGYNSRDMTTNQLNGMRMMAEAMNATDNYAVQIEVCGKWQMLWDKLTKPEAEQIANRYERTRVVKVW